ncbi:MULTISPECIES: hypothetical protein [Pseudomonas]|uniref:hypothetical protein n=1 Tax=Pseudomonas TaxID=286 RepID=UPI001B8182AE|nr:hypothetical protein [Pseudomonas juntendi]MBR7523352.1 hypothetical protein [Pseudomonas juntendi]
MLTRSQKWRNDYLLNPYLTNLYSAELEERANDIINLISVLDSSGRLSVRTGKDINVEMWIKWTHILTEMEKRHGPYPNGFTNGFIKSASIVTPTFPAAPLGKSAIDKVGGLQTGWLFKFSKKKYVQEMYHSGNFRVTPASFYNDPSLNAAIRDDELAFKGSATFKLKADMKAGNPTASYGRVEYSVKARTNYYVCCFASNYTNREFSDFEADACLVIKNPRLFINRLIKTGCHALPGFEGFAQNVKYVDPLLCNPSKIDVNFAKHFKYAYQNEYRAIWAPREATSDLPIKFISMGPLDDIAEIVEL